jgi:hypothetical protein
VYDDIDQIRAGRPLVELPARAQTQRLDKLTFLMPWKHSARFRQICHEKNLNASGELRRMLKRWLDEYEAEQTN